MAAEKKLIIICQSGGEFVTNKDGSLTYNGGDAHTIDIDLDTKFDNFRSEIAEMWNYSPATMAMKYFLPGNKRILITISNDKDLKRMINFHGDSITTDVFILTREIMALDDISNMPASLVGQPYQQQQQQPLEMDKEKEKEATQNMEVDDEESQSVTKEPTISVESSPLPFENEGFSLQSPPPTTRDEPAATIDDGTSPSPVTGKGKELQKTIEEESPLEQNEGLVVQPQSPPTKTQTGQTHFVPPRVQPAAVGVGVGASSSSSSNPGNSKEEDNTTIDILDVLRSKGFHVPRPRWWRPEGYDKP